MRRRDETHRRLQAEIAGEKAAALGRAGEQLEAALREVAACATRLHAALDPAERGNHAEAYQHARARALQARLRLLIQREALGLRRHAVVDQQFPEPPPVARLLDAAP
ncbi:MAG: hypothetical protein ACREKS_05480 [Candidatus Rokuibacteriota bacterium]